MSFEQNGMDCEFALFTPRGKMIQACRDLERFSYCFNRSMTSRYDYNECGEIYPDGINAEFNVKTEACHGWFTDGVYSAIRAIRKNFPRHEFTSFVPANKLQRDIVKEARISGCNPKRNAFTEQSSSLPDEYYKILKKRGSFLGCHLHHNMVRMANLTDSDADKLVRLMVKVSLIPVTLLIDTDEWWERLSITGIGNYRKKEYGIEYCDFGGSLIKHPLPYFMALNNDRIVTDIWGMLNPSPYDSEYNTEEKIETGERIVGELGVVDDTEVYDAFRTRDVRALSQMWDLIVPAITGGFRYELVSHSHYIQNSGVTDSCISPSAIKYLMENKKWKELDFWAIPDAVPHYFGFCTVAIMCLAHTGYNIKVPQYLYEYNRETIGYE